MISAESVHLVMREHKLAYLHVPKCAGTSVKHALAVALGYHGFGNLKRMRQMWDLDRVVSEGKDCLKFVVVRNPFDRLVSVWEHNIKGRGPGSGRIGFEPDTPFSQFVSIVHRTRKDGYLDIHVRPMVSTLVRSGQMIPDLVLRFESLAEDWSILSDVARKHCSIDLPELTHERQSKGRMPYQEYYQKDTRQMVEERFKGDFYLFGYRWEKS